MLLTNVGLYGCYDIVNNYDLSINNKTDRKVAVLYSFNVDPKSNGNNVDYYLSDENAIEPDSTYTIVKVGGKDAWRDYIDEGKTKRLYFYFFETDTLKRYFNQFTMNDFVRQKKYYKRLEYTEKELKAINWTVVVQ